MDKKKRLSLSAYADKNRQDIYYYIAVVESNTINASLVDSRIAETFNKIIEFPLSFKEFGRGTRVAFVTKTQYAIVYRVTAQTVRILRISHQRKKII